MQYEQLSALEMGRMVRAGEVAPDHFLHAAKARITALNPQLNAVIHQVDQPLATSQGLFAGVPLLMKDTGAAVAGLPMTSGSALFQGGVAAHDSTYGARLRAAGFGFLGRTNTPELALSFTTEGTQYGAVCNPWDVTRTAGGSSGGAAAVVAAGIVPLAQASDGAGSIRVPAAHCGVFGFKPSRLRTPAGPDQAEGIAGMATLHGLSRTVADSAALLDVTHGPDVGDPWGPPPGAGGYWAATQTASRRLRIALHLSGSAEVRAAALAAAKLCEGLGHHVVEAAPDYDNDAVGQAWFTIAAVNCARGVARRGAVVADPHALLEPVNADWVRWGAKVGAEAYLAAVQTLHASSRAMGRFFAQHDIYLSPTTDEVAPLLGELAGAGHSPHSFFARFWAHAPLTAVFNASGCPAMSLPLGQSAGGLPIGVQFGAAFGEERLLFALAAEIEAAAPWAARHPAIWAAKETVHVA